MSSKKLERQSWYFGFLSRREVFRHLVQVGDWCVRTTVTKGHEESILVVYSEEKRQREFNLKFYKNGDQQGYGFAKLPRTVLFPTIVELIEYFKQQTVLPKGYKLLNAASRPEMMLHEEQIELEKKKLGQGNYAEVLKGLFIDKEGKKISVAIKQSKTDFLKDVATMERDERKTTLRKIKVLIEQMTTEARLLRGVNHDNVVKIYGIACDKLPIQVVVELCPGGSLLDHIQSMKKKIAAEELNIFLLEIARGLRFLQLSKVLHRDIAARNCLIGSRGQVVISDFGLSKSYEELNEDDDGVQMAIPWMAPETLSLVHELYTFGTKPWPELDVDAIIAVVRQGKKMKPPENMAENVQNLMYDCWSRKPSERPDFVVVVRRLHLILEEGEIPEPAARSIANIQNIQLVPFNLNDETDLEIVEYTCASEDCEDDLSSRRRRCRNSDKNGDSSGSLRRRKSDHRHYMKGSVRYGAGPASQNNETDQDMSKEDEECESSNVNNKRGSRRRTRKSDGSFRGATSVGRGVGVQKRQTTGSLPRRLVAGGLSVTSVIGNIKCTRKTASNKHDPKPARKTVERK
ncbi:hypothetical protein QR680_012335 [Steinernema hermaphroditum]|uniref:Tyrosine-protein kinase n=1 Tax=Steinernema hermaphroditum TaxID=289476 RepID=A0AA39LZP4_9BILA|nr:hypothetical protein QR680_012335 [Steinernema hermaphroditum]